MIPFEDVFTQEEITFFWENGYVVLHEAVPPENLQAVVDAIWDFLGMDPNDPEDWYPPPPHRVGGMVEMYQHQALWNNRQAPRIYNAFRQLLGTHKLWVSMDRANMKPPPPSGASGVRPQRVYPLGRRRLSASAALSAARGALSDRYRRDDGGLPVHSGASSAADPVVQAIRRIGPLRFPDLKQYTPTPIPGRGGGLCDLARCAPSRQWAQRLRSPSIGSVHHDGAGAGGQ
ncbi:MAG: hypothetical protein KatS3mg115_1832 [Candidatus Poribacteria bacterium]|nr:MAG: hypothetical protein KatS3mg115_1832 [Candidatus Poribacteria bacterium]